jgi:hypothetical protein
MTTATNLTTAQEDSVSHHTADKMVLLTRDLIAG